MPDLTQKEYDRLMLQLFVEAVIRRLIEKTHNHCLLCGGLKPINERCLCPRRGLVLQPYKLSAGTSPSWDNHEVHSWTVDGE